MAALVRLKRGSVQLRHAALEMKGKGENLSRGDINLTGHDYLDRVAEAIKKVTRYNDRVEIVI